ncbi:MAG: hypothetical protein NTX96_00500 [Candidatus Zambryskibacteria bacterium]|nr:hypothetical protein [Candidatus Zambryskibacteria bacterium]
MNNIQKHILIATGIYPPEIGGPAEYAKNLTMVWREQKHEVNVKVFSRFNFLPTGIRHLIYFFDTLPSILKSDLILALDTYSCGLPVTLASLIFRKKIILRTGGDFLWEAYVERTGDLVLLRDFYKTRLSKLSIKEKIIFKLTKFVLKNVDAIIWSTEWQKDIFIGPYNLSGQNNFIVENYYGPRIVSLKPLQKNFIAMTRKLKWKHVELLKKVFGQQVIVNSGSTLDTDIVPHEEFLEKLRHSYAVIIASLGDISPNTILDAIRCGIPFILTKETGLIPRIKDIAILIDPENLQDITEKVLWLSDEKNYEAQKKKIESFGFIHSWKEIANEYLNIYKNIK